MDMPRSLRSERRDRGSVFRSVDARKHTARVDVLENTLHRHGHIPNGMADDKSNGLGIQVTQWLASFGFRLFERATCTILGLA